MEEVLQPKLLINNEIAYSTDLCCIGFLPHTIGSMYGFYAGSLLGDYDRLYVVPCMMTHAALPVH